MGGAVQRIGWQAAATPLPLGLGLDEFGRASRAIPAVKERFRQLDNQVCQEIAARIPFNSKGTAFLRAKTPAFGSPRSNASPPVELYLPNHPDRLP
jgi:hypothetical protein